MAGMLSRAKIRSVVPSARKTMIIGVQNFLPPSMTRSFAPWKSLVIGSTRRIDRMKAFSS
jgi:hypothetical protein